MSQLISGEYKIVFGQQQGRGVTFGPVSPNGILLYPKNDSIFR